MLVCASGGQPYVVRKHRNKGGHLSPRAEIAIHSLSILILIPNPKWLDEILEYCPGVKVCATLSLLELAWLRFDNNENSSSCLSVCIIHINRCIEHNLTEAIISPQM